MHKHKICFPWRGQTLWNLWVTARGKLYGAQKCSSLASILNNAFLVRWLLVALYPTLYKIIFEHSPFLLFVGIFAYHFIHFPAATKHFHVIQSFVIVFGTGQEIHSRSNFQSLEIVWSRSLKFNLSTIYGIYVVNEDDGCYINARRRIN